MKLDTFNKYLEKSGDIYGTMYPADIVLDNEHGFCTMAMEGSKLVVYQCYGDGRYWEEVINSTAKKKGATGIVFLTTRNPKAFERKFGCKVKGYLLEREVR